MMMTRILFPLLAGVCAVAQAQPPAEPNWSFGLKFPPETVRSWGEARAERSIQAAEADVLVWTPPGAERIRAALLIANNTDLVKIGEHTSVRAMAARHDMAILYFRVLSGSVVESADPPVLAEPTFQTVMDLAAEHTGLEGFRNAPWITMGKSSRGRFPFRIAWAFPERVVATIAYHGETPTWPIPAWSETGADASILHVNIQGLTEWDGTWYRHVRPSLLNYNAHSNWLAHQVVVYGVDHGYYMDYYLYPNHGANLPRDHRLIRVTQVWDYLAAFMDTALELRLPEEHPGPGEPVRLRQVARDSGFWVHPRAPEELLGTKWFALRRNEAGLHQIIPWPQETTPVLDVEQGHVPPGQLVRHAAAVPEEERGHGMWIPTRRMLNAWLNLHDIYKLSERVLAPLDTPAH